MKRPCAGAVSLENLHLGGAYESKFGVKFGMDMNMIATIIAI